MKQCRCNNNVKIHSYKNPMRTILQAGGTIIVASLILSACSSASHHSQVASSQPKVNALSLLTKFKSELAKAEAAPQFQSPGPPVDASKAKGSSVLIMPITSEIGTCTQQSNDLKTLGQSFGMKMAIFSNSGVPSQWVSGVEDAISGHYNALAIFCGIVPGAIAPQLAAAESAGVKVVDGEYNEVSNYKYLDAETPADFIGMMREDVEDAFVNLNGKPIHAIDVTTDSIVQGPAATGEVGTEVSKLCSSCSVEQVIDVPAADWATEVQNDVASALVAHPNVNVVFVNFDGMVQFTVPAVEQSHRAGLKIYTAGASASVAKLMLQSNPIIEADPGGEPIWEAYAEMDQLLRLITGEEPAPVNKEFIPYVLLTPSNVKQFFGPNDTYSDTGFGTINILNGFRKLWGVAPIK